MLGHMDAGCIHEDHLRMGKRENSKLPPDGRLGTRRYRNHALAQVLVDERGFPHVGFPDHGHEAGAVIFGDVVLHGLSIVLASARAVKPRACMMGLDPPDPKEGLQKPQPHVYA